MLDVLFAYNKYTCTISSAHVHSFLLSFLCEFDCVFSFEFGARQSNVKP